MENVIDEGVEVVANFIEMVYSEVGVSEEIMEEVIVDSVIKDDILLVMELVVNEDQVVLLQIVDF